MTIYANSLLEGHNQETIFFYASPAQSLRADGVLYASSDANELWAWADTHGVANDAIIVGALPFNSGDNAQFILPRQTFIAGPASPHAIADKTNAMTARLTAQFPTPHQYLCNVDTALSLFKTTPLRKVVLSRMIELAVDNEVDIKALLSNLLTTNRLGRVFYFANQDSSALVGATPEVILSKQGAMIQSIPLAGSRARNKDPVLDFEQGQSLVRASKDLHEHALLVDSIAAILKPFCKALHVPKQPSLISTPTMWHLASSIKGVLNDPMLDSLSLAQALHPTPAVCGSPTQLACETIKHLEGYEREQYAGLVGWMNQAGDGEWALSIRCAKIMQKSVRLYAGAGIVEGSQSNLELSETTAKFATIANALGITF